MEQYDVVMIGKGPAGISAALYTVRAGLKTLVTGTDASSLMKTEQIENYYGFEQPVSGAQLLAAGVAQAKRIGAAVIGEEVTSVEFVGSFAVKTESGEYAAKAVLIATGQSPRRPNLPGVEKFEGKGVSYCTTCDGFFFRSKRVGVLGSGNYAVQEVMELMPFTKDITLYTNGAEPAFTGEYAKKAEEFPIRKSRILGLSGDKSLEEIRLEDGSQKLDGLFIASGTASSLDFAVKLGIEVRDRAIVVNDRQMTNVEGIFAAGDCTGGFKQISTAVGQGATAGRSIIEFVRKH